MLHRSFLGSIRFVHHALSLEDRHFSIKIDLRTGLRAEGPRTLLARHRVDLLSSLFLGRADILAES